jgi:transcriptional regulator GlxA family with amidase domain
VAVEEDSIFIGDRGVWTSAGVTAGIDLALALLEEDAGEDTALAERVHMSPRNFSNTVAQRLVARRGRPAAPPDDPRRAR